MTLEETVFKRATADFSKLEPYGFTKIGTDFVLEKPFMDNAFKALITIDKTGTVSGRVYDADTGDIYLPLRVENGSGGYAGQVRAAYKTVLESVRDNCFVSTLFIGDQANRIARKIFEIYGDNPDFPWKKYDAYGVFRNPDTGKWYGLIMNIDKSKLNRKPSGAVDVMNLKIAADKIPDLIERNGFYPAYHMNKKHWISVVLNDTLPDETVLALIKESRSVFSQYRK